MSRDDWESGTITLPAADAPVLKKTLRDWCNALHEQVRLAAIHRHREVGQGTRSVQTYVQRVHDARYGYPRRLVSTWRPTPGTRLPQGVNVEFISGLADEVLDRIASNAQYRGGTIHQPTVADVNLVAPKMTNRDNQFRCVGEGDDAVIVFDGRKVTWETGCNNRQVERAHDTPLAKVFFAALNRIQWTRGTGGALVGNDEYNEDNREAGGGGNYITGTYGPLGDEARVTEHMRNGFSRKQAKEMVEAAKRPVRSFGYSTRAFGW